MSLEERVQRLTRGESKQTAQFRLREMSQAELRDRECLQNATRQVAGSTQPGHEIIRNRNGHIHRCTLGRHPLAVKSRQPFKEQVAR